jgi:hypothetical protein
MDGFQLLDGDDFDGLLPHLGPKEDLIFGRGGLLAVGLHPAVDVAVHQHLLESCHVVQEALLDGVLTAHCAVTNITIIVCEVVRWEDKETDNCLTKSTHPQSDKIINFLFL